jgi:hypothetical protein
VRRGFSYSLKRFPYNYSLMGKVQHILLLAIEHVYGDQLDLSCLRNTHVVFLRYYNQHSVYSNRLDRSGFRYLQVLRQLPQHDGRR